MSRKETALYYFRNMRYTEDMIRTKPISALLCIAILFVTACSDSAVNDTPAGQNPADTSQTLQTTDTSDSSDTSDTTDTHDTSDSPEIPPPHPQQLPETSVAPPDGFAFLYEFATTDLFGNAVNRNTLGVKRAFYVYHWATWCSPCVSSFPTLAQLARDYGEDIGFIALLDDFGTNQSGALNIANSANAPANLIIVDAKDLSVSSLVAAVSSGFFPTSVIFTQEGEPASFTGAINERQKNILNEILRP
jgi:thiol-disulfide isomerase/thioredoxin